jgi:hypothetical protein
LRPDTGAAYDEAPETRPLLQKEICMRPPSLPSAIVAAALLIASLPAAAFNCYLIVDKGNEVTYQGGFPPIDLSDDGMDARNAMRIRGDQLIVMDTDTCPPIDRGRTTSARGPASVEEIVAGMRSAVPYGSSVQPARAETTTTGGMTLPKITVPRATGGGMSVGGPPSSMSIR